MRLITYKIRSNSIGAHVKVARTRIYRVWVIAVWFSDTIETCFQSHIIWYHNNSQQYISVWLVIENLETIKRTDGSSNLENIVQHLFPLNFPAPKIKNHILKFAILNDELIWKNERIKNSYVDYRHCNIAKEEQSKGERHLV